MRLKSLFLGAVALLASAMSADAADKLVIAGRDAGFGKALAKMVELYKAKNPGLDIEQLELPYAGLYEKLTIAAREKTAAYDVVLIDDTWAVEFMSKGWLADLDKLGGIDKDFIKHTVDVSRYPVGTGALYAVPFVGNVAMFAYRKDLIDKHGLKAPGSWTDVLAVAKTLADKEPGVAGAVFRGIKGNPIVTGFLPILWAHGGQVVDAKGDVQLDSAAALKALNVFLALKAVAPKGVETYNASEIQDALQQGKAAMSIEIWPSWAPQLDDPAKSKVPGKIEIVAPPGETRGPAPMLGAWLIAIPADSKNAKRARDFIDFATSAENQKLIALDIGNPPTRASVYKDPAVVAKYRWYPAQLAALEASEPRPRITQWSKVETILGDYLQLALVGQMAPKEALAEAQGKVKAALR